MVMIDPRNASTWIGRASRTQTWLLARLAAHDYVGGSSRVIAIHGDADPIGRTAGSSRDDALKKAGCRGLGRFRGKTGIRADQCAGMDGDEAFRAKNVISNAATTSAHRLKAMGHHPPKRSGRD